MNCPAVVRRPTVLRAKLARPVGAVGPEGDAERVGHVGHVGLERRAAGAEPPHVLGHRSRVAVGHLGAGAGGNLLHHPADGVRRGHSCCGEAEQAARVAGVSHPQLSVATAGDPSRRQARERAELVQLDPRCRDLEDQVAARGPQVPVRAGGDGARVAQVGDREGDGAVGVRGREPRHLIGLRDPEVAVGPRRDAHRGVDLHRIELGDGARRRDPGDLAADCHPDVPVGAAGQVLRRVAYRELAGDRRSGHRRRRQQRKR